MYEIILHQRPFSYARLNHPMNQKFSFVLDGTESVVDVEASISTVALKTDLKVRLIYPDYFLLHLFT